MTTNPEANATTDDLAGREVIVGVSGGIAAYKVCDVVSQLVQRGCGVTVAMTRAARRFVQPLTFQALSGRPVLTSLWSDEQPGDVQHITLTENADLMILAPATADLIGRIAGGIANDVLTTLVISADTPTVLAPAMNNRMWANPIVQRNVNSLIEIGYTFVGPREGWLACRSKGPGRMAEPNEIVDAASTSLFSPGQATP